MTKDQIIQKIFAPHSLKEFNELSLKIFCLQYQTIPVYRQFCDLLCKNPENINSVEQIPFLPIELFKSKKIISKNTKSEIIFKSSGTTSSNRSSHYVSDIVIYEKSLYKGFEYFFGSPEKYTFLALLPGYIERKEASLVYMIKHLISRSNYMDDSGFYLNNHDELFEKLKKLSVSKSRKVILIGVTHALLDFSEKFKIHFPNLIVMETGGMKGFRKELIREELHELLSKAFGVRNIYSEYGMTELLSQAYSIGNGVFKCPTWMRVSVRDSEDPLSSYLKGKGALNVTDFSNINSCSFIATSDLGKVNADFSFEVLGRIDNSDIRGCNLLSV